jgi:hypothetical protein
MKVQVGTVRVRGVAFDEQTVSNHNIVKLSHCKRVYKFKVRVVYVYLHDLFILKNNK